MGTLAISTRFGIVTVEHAGPPAAPALIALHGIPSSRRDLLVLAPHIGGDIDLIGIDMPGFGDSEPGEAASLHDWAEIVEEVADDLGLARFSVLGHSLGGLAAMLVASRLPDRVHRLVLLDSAGLRPHALIRQNPPAAFAALMQRLDALETRDEVMEIMRGLYASLDLDAPDDWRRLRCQLRVGSTLDFDDVARRAPGIRTPTTVIHAVDDPGLETELAEELAATLPNARLVLLDHGGHFPQRTVPAAVASHILAALR